MLSYWLQYFVPGIVLILLGFIAGSQRNMALGLLGFLPFFSMGVILIVVGLRKGSG